MTDPLTLARDPRTLVRDLRTLARTGPLPRSVRRDFALALAAAGELEEARRVGLPLLAGDEDHDHADEELAEALGEH